ncbi:TonB-dependent receptor [Sphingomonas sp. MMSM24]|uniref:TonB-dependent receptor n=1 Tax=Sphingomonas lycopersici TaxID=2951807 RepID=A0AA41ZJZ5_9SPHN|nr:TonB-dependent receptor [Sphingomonas sp. 66-10]MCW6530507.1 TonB-dependent receptor [Sphingomonas lycopersici]MCW6537193.1 TonB-dependent receptor [Sphingomonas lycopersici]
MIVSINRTRPALLAGVAASLAVFAAPAHAQTADAPTPAAAPEGDGLGEIVVTAERRSENLQKVPVSVAAVSGADLRNFQAAGEDILSLSGRVPSLYIETTTGRIFPRFYIRGLGNVDFYLGASQPVSIIQDDVVLEHVVLKSNPVYDVAQVEVLRGPQGSLFGRNTTAGIIKFDTQKPTMDWQGRGSASWGSYNTVSADVGIGGPIVADKLAFRVSGMWQHRDNWVSNNYAGPSADGTKGGKDVMGGFNDRNARLQLLFTPTDTFSIDVSGHVRDYDGTSTLFHRAALKKGSNNVQAEPRDIVAYDEANNNVQSYKTQGASVRAAWNFGGATLTSITAYEHSSGYSRGDTDGGAAVNFPFNGNPNGFGQSEGYLRGLDQWTQELRLASDGNGPFKWQFGGFYFDSRDITDFYQRGYFLLPTSAGYNPNNWVRLHDVNTSWAVFGQASYKIGNLTLTGGARYTEDRKHTTLLQAALNAAGTTANFPANAPRDVRLVGKEPSWDVSALYEVNPDLNVYARVARGFRGPTIQGRSAVFGAPFTTADSETIMSYEAGFKSQPTANLRFNATAFAYTVKNIQLNGNDSFGNGVLFNADHANAYGIEAEAEWRPIRNITFTLGASALHSKIKDSRVYAQTCSLNGVMVCTVLDPYFTKGTGTGTTYFASINGNPLPNAPTFNIDGAIRYDIPLGNGGNFFVNADANVQGYTNFVLYHTKEFYSDGNLELGLKVGYTTPDKKYEIAAFARNITNEKNLKGVIENYMAAVFNEPRVIGVSISGKFN